MSKSTIVIDGSGASVTFNAVPITEINTIAFGIRGAKQVIDLTTIDNTKWKTKLASVLKKVEDVTINKKFDPVADAALYNVASQALAITYKIGRSTEKTLTFYAQLKSAGTPTLEREPADGINTDLVFAVTNLSGATFVETGPAIA